MIKLRLFLIEDYLDMGNRFIEITDETIGVHANQEVAIGGIIVRIRKIMICTKDWLLRNYYLALQKTQNYLNRPKYPSLSYEGRNISGFSDDDICCCNIV